MSSNRNPSTIATAERNGDENAPITGSISSVKLQASRFQRLSNAERKDLLSLMNKTKGYTASTTNHHRSLSNQLRNASNNHDEVAHTGSEKVEQTGYTQAKTGDRFNKYNKQLDCNNGHEMASKTNKIANESDQILEYATTDDDDYEDDEQDDDAGTDESIDDTKNEKVTSNNNNIRPKPGRLDLSQFDNITSAIAKLNVQPQQKVTPKVASNKSTKSCSWIPGKRNPEPTSRQNVTVDSKTIAESPAQPLVPLPRRQLQNLRKNHGRPVAPPRLPVGLVVSSSAPSSSAIINSDKADNSRHYMLDDRFIDGCSFSSRKTISNLRAPCGTSSNDVPADLNLSPIAQRLLRPSKDHRVCELSSHESDSDLPPTPAKTVPRALPRAHETHKARDAFSPIVTIGPYKRTHSAEPNELISSRGETIRQLNEILARPPTSRPSASSKLSRDSSTEEQLHRDQLSVAGSSSARKSEKESRKDKKRDEKLEKRKQKEEEKLRRQEEEKQRRQEKKLAAKRTKSGNNAGDKTVDDDGIPMFIKRCIEFIEAEGMDAEGIYRVPGNRAHVDTFVQKFKDNPQMSIRDSDIPVNAVATALKDFLSKKLGPIIPPELMDKLTGISNISVKEQRARAVRDLIRQLPATNYNILRYVFSHFVKVSMNNTLNSMDSKNLAICWWPTLLPLQFNDMLMFEQMRPHLEESIQTMIDQYDFIFDCDDLA